VNNFEEQKENCFEDKSTQAKECEYKNSNNESEKQMSFGKFADAQTLFTAYQNLQREFTKKSQKLKQLENQLNCDNGKNKVELNDEFLMNDGQNNQLLTPPQNILSDKISSQLPTAKGQSVDNPVADMDSLSLQLSKDKDFLEKYILSNPDVTREVLQRYIEFLSQSDLPNTINSKNGFMSLTPPKKPKTIKEASLMAQKIFNN